MLLSSKAPLLIVYLDRSICNSSSQQTLEHIHRRAIIDLYTPTNSFVISDFEMANLLPTLLPNRPIDLQSLLLCYIIDNDPRYRMVYCSFRGSIYIRCKGSHFIVEASDIAIAKRYYTIIYSLLVSLDI
jgi:hypothetical protein